MREIFKDITGIITTHKENAPPVPLPGPRAPGAPMRMSESGMPLMDPRFDSDVLHPDNRAIFNKAADLAVHSLNVSFCWYSWNVTYMDIG